MKLMEDNKEKTEIDWGKVGKDLRFIELATRLAKDLNCRVIIHGGYAVDGALGKITRPHNDIDVQIFGQGSNTAQAINGLINKISRQDPSFANLKMIDKGRKEFYHNFVFERPGFGADIYYIQVETNPFASEKVVIKNDGSKTEAQEWETRQVILEGVSFEAQSPEVELRDRLKKRGEGEPIKPKRDQDIANLQHLLGRFR